MPQPINPTIRAIARLAATASFDSVGLEYHTPAQAAACLRAGTVVGIAWLSSETDDDRVATACALQEAGLVPLPHLPTQLISDTVAFDRLAGRLRNEAGASQIMLLDHPSNLGRGDLASALEMLTRGRLRQHGYERVALMAHFQEDAARNQSPLDAALDTQIAVALDSGKEPIIITPLCYDAARLLRRLTAFRERNPDISVRVGLAGPTSVQQHLQEVRLNGTDASACAIIGEGVSIVRQPIQSTSDVIIRQLAESDLANAGATIGLHMHPLGGLKWSAQWIDDIARGHIRLDTRGYGFATGNAVTATTAH